MTNIIRPRACHFWPSEKLVKENRCSKKAFCPQPGGGLPGWPSRLWGPQPSSVSWEIPGSLLSSYMFLLPELYDLCLNHRTTVLLEVIIHKSLICSQSECMRQGLRKNQIARENPSLFVNSLSFPPHLIKTDNIL